MNNELFFYSPQKMKRAIKFKKSGEPYVTMVADTKSAGRVTVIGIVGENTITFGKSQVNNRLEAGQKPELFRKDLGRNYARENAVKNPLLVVEYTDRNDVGKIFNIHAKKFIK